MSEHPRLVQGGAEFFCRKALTRMVDDIFRQMGEAETDGQTQLNLGGVRVQRFFTVKRFGKNSKGFKARVPFRKLKLAELKEIIEGKKKPKKLSRDYEKLQILIEDLEKKGVSFDLTIEELGE